MSASVSAGSLRFRRYAFWAYAAVLFTGTHYPNLRMPGPPIRTDLFVHLSIFGTWTAILIAAGFFGPTLSWRNIRLAAIIAPIYAAIDESLQAIPFVHRTAAFDDWCANVAGIMLVIAGASVLKVLADRKQSGDAISSPPQ